MLYNLFVVTDNCKPNEHVKSRYELWIKVATKKSDVKLVKPELDSLDSVPNLFKK